MAKISKPVLYTAILGVVALVIVIATEPDATAPKRSTVAKKTTTTRMVEMYLPEDYSAKFASLNESPKDAFKPLVIRRSAVQASAPDPDAIPFDATGGEPNWFYTGLVAIDGTKLALVENESTGEGVYLRQGDRWKKIVVSSISDEALILVGPGGVPFRIKLGERESDTDLVEEMPEDGSGNVAPVQPPLQGLIGTGTPTVPPLPGVTTNDLAVQAEESFASRRPRNRRQRQ